MIDIIAGARPNFVKIAPIIHAIKNSGLLDFRLIHTGQHYDKKMSADFFNQLNIPEPDFNLNVGSGSQAEQTAKIMTKYEDVLNLRKPKLCLVVGDVNSTMACSISAKKLCVPVAHVEAGIRSNDLTMPEEINRIVTDSISDLLFTTTKQASLNLTKLGHRKESIHFVGNTMIDALVSNIHKLRKPAIYDLLSLTARSYLVITLHRPANVDDEETFVSNLSTIDSLLQGKKAIFPCHPRIKSTLDKCSNVFNNLVFCEPMSYLEFNFLVKNSLGIITDSGGITEEATFMGIPCMTLRDNTERPETIEIGTNKLIGTNVNKLKQPLEDLISGKWKKSAVPEKWDGKASKRIVKVLEQI